MRMILAMLLAAFGAADGAVGQNLQRKPVPMKADFSAIENVWGLKVKSFALELVEQKTMAGDLVVVGVITYTLEFEKDITNQDLDALQKVFTDKNRRMRHLFFDQDNVAINAYVTYPYRIQGELSGVKGEAIRVTVEMDPDAEAMLQHAKKLVVRPG